MHLRSHLTYANVMVTLLAFVVLCGGGAYAASQLGKNSVGTKQLKNNAVTAAKVKNRSLTAAEFKAGQLPAGPKGDPGPAGPAGAPGAALGYAHVENNQFDAAHSKGVVAITNGIFTSGQPAESTVCFDLSISPANISVTAQVGFNSPSSFPAERVFGTLAPTGPHGGTAGCPEGFRDAQVDAYDTESSAPIGFYVLFN